MPIPTIPGNPGNRPPDDGRPDLPPNLPIIDGEKNLGFQRQINLPPISFVYPVRQRPEITLQAFDRMFMDIRMKAKAVLEANFQKAQDEDPEFAKFVKKQDKKIKKQLSN